MAEDGKPGRPGRSIRTGSKRPRRSAHGSPLPEMSSPKGRWRLPGRATSLYASHLRDPRVIVAARRLKAPVDSCTPRRAPGLNTGMLTARDGNCESWVKNQILREGAKSGMPYFTESPRAWLVCSLAVSRKGKDIDAVRRRPCRC